MLTLLLILLISRSEVIGFLCWLALVAVLGWAIWFFSGKMTAKWPGTSTPVQIFLVFLIVVFVVYLIFTVADGKLPTIGSW